MHEIKKHPFYSCFQTRGTKKQKVFLMSLGFIKLRIEVDLEKGCVPFYTVLQCFVL